jgi:hypothetical protein
MSRHLLSARLSRIAATAKVMPSPITESLHAFVLELRDPPRVSARTARKHTVGGATPAKKDANLRVATTDRALASPLPCLHA